MWYFSCIHFHIIFITVKTSTQTSMFNIINILLISQKRESYAWTDFHICVTVSVLLVCLSYECMFSQSILGIINIFTLSCPLFLLCLRDEMHLTGLTGGFVNFHHPLSFILQSPVQRGSPFPWPRTTSVESRTLHVWQLLDSLQRWAVTLWPLIMNPAAKRGSETNYTTVRSNICPCTDYMSLTASTHIQISPSVKAAPDDTDLFKYVNMFQMNLCPLLYAYFSIFTSVFVLLHFGPF